MSCSSAETAARRGPRTRSRGRAGRRRAASRRRGGGSARASASQPGVRSKKSKIVVREASASTPAGRQHLDRLRDARDLALLAASAAGSRSAGRRSPARRRTRRLRPSRPPRAVLAHQAQDAVARLGERRESLERLERGGQPAAVALVLAAAVRRLLACLVQVLQACAVRSRRAGFIRLSARLDERLRSIAAEAALTRFGSAASASSIRASVSSRPERSHRLEDPRRDRGAG